MVRFTASDGTEIAYDYDDSAPAGLPPVVLLHGFAVSAHLNFGVTGLIDALADAGRRTIAIDARGHGESAAPVGEDAEYGEARMAQDTRELLDHLEIERYDLVGYSMGAVTAVILASTDPRVRHLVIGGVGAGLVELGGIDTREFPPEILIQAFSAPTADEVEHPLGLAWRAFATAVDADLPALARQSAALHQAPIELEHITAPTLVLAGHKDGLANRPQVLASAIPNARLELIEADHLGAMQHPRFVPAIVDFLAAKADS